MSGLGVEAAWTGSIVLVCFGLVSCLLSLPCLRLSDAFSILLLLLENSNVDLICDVWELTFSAEPKKRGCKSAVASVQSLSPATWGILGSFSVSLPCPMPHQNLSKEIMFFLIAGKDEMLSWLLTWRTLAVDMQAKWKASKRATSGPTLKFHWLRILCQRACT